MKLLGQRGRRTFIARQNEATDERIRVAVIMGGYSSERHISVESGRNIYEKLSSSAKKYAPVPVFLTGSAPKNYRLYDAARERDAEGQRRRHPREN